MRSEWGGYRRLGITVLALAGPSLLGSCARPQGPPGGPRDYVPPMVVSTWPDTFETIEATRDPVVIRYSERISERPTQGSLEGAVLVSPATGEPRVKHTRSGLEVSIIGGFQPGLVYRIRILPTVKDLFNNSMERPFELVFSTGGAYEANVIAGVVTDLLSGEPVEGVRVEAREAGEEDPPVYMATTDTAGIYVLRYVPSGSFVISLFEDVNRNRQADFRELQGETRGELLPQPSQADTLVQEVTLLRPDTTPARIIRVEALDSMLVELVFDDFLPTGGPLDEVQVRLMREESAGPGVRQLIWKHELDSLRAFEDSVRAAETARVRLDSLQVVVDSLRGVFAVYQAAGDSTASDSVGLLIENLEALIAPPAPQVRPPGRAPPRPPPILPLQGFFALLADPLAPDVLYQITVTGVANVNSLGGGGGESGITWAPPELPSDTAGVAPDTAVVRPDTAVVRPDTAGVRPDTVGVPPDTAGVPPDTAGVPPDTVAAPPDTSVAPLPTSAAFPRPLSAFHHE